MNDVVFTVEPEFHIVDKSKKAASKFHLPVGIGFPDKGRIPDSKYCLPETGLRVSQVARPG